MTKQANLSNARYIKTNYLKYKQTKFNVMKLLENNYGKLRCPHCDSVMEIEPNDVEANYEETSRDENVSTFYQSNKTYDK